MAQLAQCSVYENSNPRTKEDVPFLLDVQSDLLSVLATRVVVPLYRSKAMASSTITRLTPVVRFKGKTFVAVVPELAGISRRELGAAVGDLAQAREDILRAIDLLLTGF